MILACHLPFESELTVKIRMTIERLLSLCFAIGVILFAAAMPPHTRILAAFIQLALPLAAIWYPIELSELCSVGRSAARTPAALVRILGWVLLMLTPFGVYFFRFWYE